MKCKVWGNTWHSIKVTFADVFMSKSNQTSIIQNCFIIILLALLEFYYSIFGNWYWEVFNSGVISQGYIFHLDC